MITFSAVTKRFGDGTTALNNVSFHVKAGELVVLTGPSGSGKTTIMRLLIRDLLPTEGSVIYRGQPVEELSDKEIPVHRRKIGVVFQDYRLLPELNVWENIALPLEILGKSEGEIESRVTDLLSLVSLTDRALVFPKQLSGGEAQRVSIARALATGPSIIFADEPTGNLDKASSLSIAKLLQQIHSFGTTVLIATHDSAILDLLENERHLSLEKGKLAHDSRPSKPSKPMIKPAETDEAEAKPIKGSKHKAKKAEKPADEEIKVEVEELAEVEPVKSKVKKQATKKAGKKSKKKPTTETSKEVSLADEFQPADLTMAEEASSGTKPAKKPWPKFKLRLPSLKLPQFGKKKEPEKS